MAEGRLQYRENFLTRMSWCVHQLAARFKAQTKVSSELQVDGAGKGLPRRGCASKRT